MLLDAAQYPLLAFLEDHYPTFRREAAQLVRDDYLRWPDIAACQGKWLVYPLVLREIPDVLEVDLEAHRRRCPESTRLLETRQAVITAGFSRLEPGSHIHSHADLKGREHLRAHLGLEIPDGAAMRVGGDLHYWQEGGSFLFEGLVDHETVNFSDSPRVVLIVDFLLSPAERAVTDAANARVDPKWFEPGSGIGLFDGPDGTTILPHRNQATDQ